MLCIHFLSILDFLFSKVQSAFNIMLENKTDESLLPLWIKRAWYALRKTQLCRRLSTSHTEGRGRGRRPTPPTQRLTRSQALPLLPEYNNHHLRLEDRDSRGPAS